MIGISVAIQSGAATAAMRRLMDQAANPAAMLKVVSRKGANELKTHFRMRNRTPNKLGGKRTNFWQRIADSVQNPVIVNPRLAQIEISDPTFAQKLFGGKIIAKNANKLTVPNHALAHGRTVAVFQHETGIKLFRIRKKGGVLTNLLAGILNGALTVFYILRDSVNQQADPNALPPQDAFEAALLSTANDYYARETARANATAS